MIYLRKTSINTRGGGFNVHNDPDFGNSDGVNGGGVVAENTTPATIKGFYLSFTTCSHVRLFTLLLFSIGIKNYGLNYGLENVTCKQRVMRLQQVRCSCKFR